jgi:hypothetical protein
MALKYQNDHKIYKPIVLQSKAFTMYEIGTIWQPWTKK